MKRLMRKFQLIIQSTVEAGVFSNVSGSINGTVVIDLLKPMEIRSIMIGRSTSFHCSELGHDKTRIGMQIYVESVKTLFGDEDCQKTFLHSSGEHLYQFEVGDNLPRDTTDSDASTQLSWTNIKAVIVDHKGKTIFSDVIIQNASPKAEEQSQNANLPMKLSDEKVKTLELLEHQPNRIRFPALDLSKVKRGSREGAPNDDSRLIGTNEDGIGLNLGHQNNVRKYTSKCNGLEIQCKLKKGFYKLDETVSFVVQCENNTKKGYKHISASLIERTPHQTQYCRTHSISRSKEHRPKQIVTASIVGPPIGPKELVIWEGFLSPVTSSESAECWYTLRIEIGTKLLTKEQMEIPVIIMDDPKTPTANESATNL